MSKLVVASTRRSAGKTSCIIGIARALGIRFGYAKPFGDRLLYRKKRLWDYDAALMTNVMGLDEDPEDMTIGFHHSKLRFSYDEESTKQKIGELAYSSHDHPLVVLETGSDFMHGISVHLDPITVTRHSEGRLLVVISGDDDAVVDDVTFIERYVKMNQVPFAGVLFNKLANVEDFQATSLEMIGRLGVPVLGCLPHNDELTHVSMDYLAEALFAKVVAGEGGLSNIVRNILVGAMSTDEVLRNPVFNRSSKLVITSGDRSDMVLAALSTGAAGIVLTNNILPPANIMSKANALSIPLLQVPADTFSVAKQIDDLEPLLSHSNTEKIDLLERMVREYVDLDRIRALVD